MPSRRRGGRPLKPISYATPEAYALAAFLRRRKDESGKTLRDLEKEMHVSISQISTYIGGKVPPQRFVCDFLKATTPDPHRLGLLQDRAMELLRKAQHPAPTEPGPVRVPSGDVNAHLREVEAHVEREARWDGYVRAARRSAMEHPYPGALPGTAPPPLTAVYLRQQVLPRGKHHSHGAQPIPSRPVPAEQILQQGRNGVVLAGPGGGKSCLLRTSLISSLDRWLDCRRDAAVPVLVQAAELAQRRRPLPEALAASVTADLSAGLLEALPPEFFREAPRPGVPWLILVDGLDEITDPDSRQRVLQTLTTAAQVHPSLYRFVVATRPLPTAELDTSCEVAARYEMLPFAPEELPDFAKSWFTCLALPDAEEAADRFITGLKDTNLADMARTPLMATMLCQLYAADPGRYLPAGRSEAYGRFIDLLRERQHTPGSGGMATQTRDSIERYGPGALEAAHRTRDHLLELLAHVAAKRLAGSTEPVVDAVIGQPVAQCPAGVPKHVWRSFVNESLRRSGLLSWRADDLVFLHHTLLEFLAARHTVRDAEISAKVFADLFEHRWQPTGADKPWDPPETEETSYLGFVLDAWSDTDKAAEVTSALHRIAAHGGFSGRHFLVNQAVQGTSLPDSVRSTLASTLAASIGTPCQDPFEHLIQPAEAELLAKLGDERGLDYLMATARNRDLDGTLRRVAGEYLGSLGHTDARNILDALARDRRLDMDDRTEAAETLVSLGDRRGQDTLVELAKSPYLNDDDRVTIGDFLASAGDPRAQSILAAIMTDTEMESFTRIDAAVSLAWLGDQRGPEYLAAFVVHPSFSSPAQESADTALQHWRRRYGSAGRRYSATRR
ncbi:XRE family transcriptional regulator [Streptomyces antnestii]|uniref:XRE family transcriptional regulator n=1 Tax=Streptomyces antnestii TaxID=2494256 RepID=A0A3S2YMM8_9ACTN|nr:helix-turn-helix domain-containing protein [Streptomyces sp. San01]RVU14594.1 XRE family transcriptional regulator [Streptomyces sp. San01]